MQLDLAAHALYTAGPKMHSSEYIREDLEHLKLLHNQACLAQDRDSRRDSIEVLLGHTQHNAGNV